MNYVVTLDDLIEIEKVYYYDNNEEEQLIGLTGDPHYEVANNTITVISTNEIPIPRIDYKSSKTGINLGTVGAVDINSVTDENENNLEYVVNDDNTLTVSNLNIGDSIKVNYDLERIRIGALEYEDGDKSKNPTKYGMRIRNSQGEDVLTTDDNGDITMTGTIHAYAGDFTGTVNAQAGEFSGNVRVGSDDKYVALTTELENGPAIASSDYMNDRNTGWAIIGNGDAYFHNITARGCIRTAVFEYEEINAVGGAFLFRPSSTIRSALLDDDDIIITVEKDNGFNNGDWVKIAGAGSTAASLFGGIYQIEKVYDIYYGDESNETSESSEVLVPCTYRLLGAAADFSPYIPEQDGERVSVLEGGAFISLCGEPDESSEFYDNYGIGINSGQGQLFMPERAISLFETSVDDSGSSPKVSMAYTGILGTLPKLEFFQTGVDESSQPTYSVDTDIYRNMEKTQGIYTNNMYIGDANQYVAFYEESNEKVLDIAAGSISVGMGDYDPLYLIGDQYGVALYKGDKTDSTQTINTNNVYITDENIQIRDGQNPLALFSQDNIKLITNESMGTYTDISSGSYQIYNNGDLIYNLGYSTVERERETKTYKLSFSMPVGDTIMTGIEKRDYSSLFTKIIGNLNDNDLNDYYDFNNDVPMINGWGIDILEENTLTVNNNIFTIEYDKADNETYDIIRMTLTEYNTPVRSIYINPESKTGLHITAREETFPILLAPRNNSVIELGFWYNNVLYSTTFTAGVESSYNFNVGSFSFIIVKYDGLVTFTVKATEPLVSQFKIYNLYAFYYAQGGIYLDNLTITQGFNYSLPSLSIGYSDDIRDYAFALGKGTGPNDRETAFGVDWDGHLYVYDDIIFTGQTNDGYNTRFFAKSNDEYALVETGTYYNQYIAAQGYMSFLNGHGQALGFYIDSNGHFVGRNIPVDDSGEQYKFDWSSYNSERDTIWDVDMTAPSTRRSATVSSSYSGSCSYIQFGKMVIFSAEIATTGTLANNTVLATGLPGSYVRNVAFIAQDNNTGSNFTHTICVSDSGNLTYRGNATTSANRSLRISGAYISV